MRLAVLAIVAALLPAPSLSQPACLPESVIDCSTRVAGFNLGLASKSVVLFNELFKDACKNHDFCYRFGATTYGYTRKECDVRFGAEMQDVCHNKLGIALAVLSLGVTEAACLSASNAYYAAVRTLGSDAFASSDEGRYCEYDGLLREDVRDHRTGRPRVIDHRDPEDRPPRTRDHRTDGSGNDRSPAVRDHRD